MDYATALVEEGRRLAGVIRAADPATPVPTCPGWTLRQLLVHVGRGDRWAAEIVRTGGPVELRAVPDGRPPEDLAAAAEWMVGGARLLVDGVAAEPEKPVWTFLGPRPARFWLRRRLHESTVHRADAALAAGVPYRIEPELAADGLSEFLDLLALQPEQHPSPVADGVALHLHATDGDLGPAGEWVLRGDGATLRWEHAHAKGAAAVRATAADLLLAVLRRIPGDDARLDVLGDRAVWAHFLERVVF